MARADIYIFMQYHLYGEGSEIVATSTMAGFDLGIH